MDFMQRNHRYQSSIRKQVNVVHINSMPVSRPSSCSTAPC